MAYELRLANQILIRNSVPSDAEQIDAEQRIVYPTLAYHQRAKAEHFLRYMAMFPAGQFTALSGDKVVGSTTSILVDNAFIAQNHSFPERFEDGSHVTVHNHLGTWLYGLDIAVLPEYRRLGIARALYVARHQTVRQLNLKGQFTVGMLNGYGAIKESLTAEEYIESLKQGKIVDPTLSVQLKVGFEFTSLIPEYLEDPACANYGIGLILKADKDVCL